MQTIIAHIRRQSPEKYVTFNHRLNVGRPSKIRSSGFAHAPVCCLRPDERQWGNVKLSISFRPSCRSSAPQRSRSFSGCTPPATAPRHRSFTPQLHLRRRCSVHSVARRLEDCRSMRCPERGDVTRDRLRAAPLPVGHCACAGLRRLCARGLVPSTSLTNYSFWLPEFRGMRPTGWMAIMDVETRVASPFNGRRGPQISRARAARMVRLLVSLYKLLLF